MVAEDEMTLKEVSASMKGETDRRSDRWIDKETFRWTVIQSDI